MEWLPWQWITIQSTTTTQNTATSWWKRRPSITESNITDLLLPAVRCFTTNPLMDALLWDLRLIHRWTTPSPSKVSCSCNNNNNNSNNKIKTSNSNNNRIIITSITCITTIRITIQRPPWRPVSAYRIRRLQRLRLFMDNNNNNSSSSSSTSLITAIRRHHHPCLRHRPCRHLHRRPTPATSTNRTTIQRPRIHKKKFRPNRVQVPQLQWITTTNKYRLDRHLHVWPIIHRLRRLQLRHVRWAAIPAVGTRQRQQLRLLRRRLFRLYHQQQEPSNTWQLHRHYQRLLPACRLNPAVRIQSRMVLEEILQ